MQFQQSCGEELLRERGGGYRLEFLGIAPSRRGISAYVNISGADQRASRHSDFNSAIEAAQLRADTDRGNRGRTKRRMVSSGRAAERGNSGERGRARIAWRVGGSGRGRR